MRKLITFFRVLSLPLIIFLVLLGSDQFLLAGLGVFILSVGAGFLQGFLVYTRRQPRSFFDPFADKVLTSGLLFFFALLGSFSWLLLIALVVRDVIVGVVRYSAAREDVEVHGEWFGRGLIVCEYAILFLLFMDEFLVSHLVTPFPVSTSLLDIGIVGVSAIALVIAAVSVVHYLYTYQKALRVHRQKLKHLSSSIPLCIVANPASRGYHDGYRRHLLRVFARRRRATLSFLSKQGDMFGPLRTRLTKAHYVVFAGGDGTFESALNDRLFFSKAIGFFPLGAGNAFYSYFYKGKRFEYLRSRFAFRTQMLDVLELEWDGKKRQTLFVGLGFDGEVMKRSLPRTTHGFRDYMKGSFSTLFKTKGAYELSCTVDGEEYVWERCVNLILAKIPYYGYGVRSLPGVVDPTDGMVYGTACVNSHSVIFNKPLRVWSLILPLFRLTKPPLVSLKGEEIIIESAKPFPFHAGGEFMGYTKRLKVRVVRQQKVLMI